ncbi:MAG: iron transporter [Gemmatales bacterium]|nr:MAG: iron transporter [Gemmatales bacterium]
MRTFTVLVFCLLALVTGCSSNPRVVLYCAQDREFAEPILESFRQRTGIEVAVQFDTEANKSVALYQQLLRERQRPRCDVFWNNEILGTIRLQKAGLLQPYSSPSAIDFPDFSRPADRTWQAFAARARILIVNTELVAESDRPQSIFDLTKPKWTGKAVMALPQFGTTATQAACLFEVLGPEKAKQFYLDLKANGISIVPGNKQVAEAVAAGKFAVGFTDTDDAIVELEAGKPVAIVFPDRDGHKDHPRFGTLFLPNTVAIVRNSPNPKGARQLVDYLLSAEVETRLAQQGSRQIPLNPKIKIRPHPQIETPATVREMEVDFVKAASLWEETQRFLREQFAR